MISFTFWIKAPGAREVAGPLSFPELRGLLQSGLLGDDTLVADDDFLYHPLRDYPELRDALNDPSVDDVVREPAAKLAPRAEVAHRRDENTSAPIANPTERDLIDFDAVRRGERGYAVYDVLALNRAAEPEMVITMPPWYKRPRVIDLARWSCVGIPVGLLFWARCPRNDYEMTDYFLMMELAVYVMLFTGSAWHIFLVDYHWYGKATAKKVEKEAKAAARQPVPFR